MAALNFPNSPSLNDTHTENGVTFKWNGAAWDRLGDIGAQGAAGAAGAQGAAGAAGAQGSTGPVAGSSSQVVYKDGSNNPAGSANFTFDGTNLSVSGNVSIGGTLTYEDVTNIDSVGIVTARAGVKVPDNQKVFLGTGDDLQIYHDSATGDSFIKETGSGNLKLVTSTFRLRNAADTEHIIWANQDAEVRLYHNNEKKFETTNTGATITGNLNLFSSSSTLTDLNFTDSALNVYARVEGGKSGSGVGDLRFHTYSGGLSEQARITSAGEVYIGSTAANGQGKLFVNDSSGATTTQAHVRNAVSTGTAKVFLNLDDSKYASVGLENGDLIFRNSTSSTPTERLRINASGTLIVAAGGNLQMASNGRIFVGNGGNATNPMFANVSDTNTGIAFPSADTMMFTTGGSERLRIASTGLVTVTGRAGAAANTAIDPLASFVLNDGEARLQLCATNGGSNAAGVILSNESKHFIMHQRGPNVSNRFDIGYLDDSSPTDINNQATRLLTLDQHGNMGLGVTPIAPGSTALHLGETTASQPVRLHMTTATTGATASDGFTLSIDGSSSVVNMIQRENSHISFYTNNTERLRIDSTGNVNIGAKDFHSHNGTVDSLQIGYALNLYEDSYTNGTDNYGIWANNAYYASSGGNKYMRDDEASRIYQHSGQIVFETAAAGTADNAITFNERLRITQEGGYVLKSYGRSIRYYTTTTNNSMYRTVAAISMQGNTAYEIRFTGTGNGITHVKCMASHWTSSYDLVRESYIAMNSYDGLSIHDQINRTSGTQGAWSYNRPSSGQTGYQSHFIINKSAGSYGGGMIGCIVLESDRPYELLSIT